VSARARFDFTPSSLDELELRVGDVIAVGAHSGDWWTGTIGARHGTFPANRVEVVSSLPDGGAAASPAEMHTGEAEASMATQAPQKGDGAAGAPALCVRALFEFAPSNPDELALWVGDVVTVGEREGEWWTGRTADGRQGMFPSNYVEVVVENNADGQGAAV
jgi:hypothetical protein